MDGPYLPTYSNYSMLGTVWAAYKNIALLLWYIQLFQVTQTVAASAVTFASSLSMTTCARTVRLTIPMQASSVKKNEMTIYQIFNNNVEYRKDHR